MTAKIRRLVIIAFLSAWQSVCNYKNCEAGAIATGTYPCNRDVALSSHFVSPLHERYAEKARAHEEYLEKSFNINGKLLTDEDALNALNQKLIDNESPEYCLLSANDSTYKENIAFIYCIYIIF